MTYLSKTLVKVRYKPSGTVPPNSRKINICWETRQSGHSDYCVCTVWKSKGLGRKDWKMLVQLMKFISDTIEDVLQLSMEKCYCILKSYIDVVFGVHPDFRGHTGYAFRI